MNKQDQLRIINNFINKMTKAYRNRTVNWCVVRDILMNGTSTAGMGSCVNKCIELGIDPDGYKI